MSNQNDFKAFAIGGNANVVSQEDYQNNSNLDIGLPPNKLEIDLLNKILRQTSTMSSVMANFMSTQCEQNVLDDGDVSGLSQKFSDSLKCHEEKQFPNQLMQNGYQEFPNGLMIQWGMYKFTPLAENKVDLPIPFKNAILNIQIIDTGYAAIPMSGIGNGTLNSFRAWVSGRFFTYSGDEVKLTPEMNINGQYLVIGY
ncbi:gp53-like domain-containing protein [Xenorhabdus cabanillasii]|uniref:Tail fiber protein n=1 Tax=Xenorhabdus cabanillasii JM26 TaxID=1427517 RepID=W1JA97_9GAMM|nr:hypothetical protein [Xenorhabdus cabanillasii]PHM76546.1 putative protein StfE [Xenorhabdus cabanillasii JM26]CDL86821.1 putative tail fiber protein [Xenorhabdus cabanillasii JM26]